MKHKKQTKKNLLINEEIHRTAIQRFEASFSAERNQRDLCIEDMSFVFVEGSQWSDTATESRTDRPRYSVNKILGPVNQIIGEQRQNRVSIKVRAAKGDASKDNADILAGLVRNIENSSHFKDIKDNAFKEIVSGGFGGWCVTTGYSDDDSFDQEIKIKTIRSAASSIYYDPSAVDELKRDASWVMVTEDIDKKYFEKKYPDSVASSLSTNHSQSYLQDWQSRDTVRIADYWVKEPVIKTIAQMTDGRVLELNDDTKSIIDELAEQGVSVLKTRQKHCHKVVMYKISAGEVLEGPFEWAGHHIPVVPVFGYNVWINNQHYYNGVVRAAKDPQRIFNYATSQAIETSALSPKDPYWVTPAQMQGLESDFANFNVKNTPFMRYNEDPNNPGPPKRTGAPSVQTALIQQVQQADMDVQATTGLFAPSLGQNETDQSGRAILALQRAGNVGTHELVDNLVKAIEFTGQILIDLIPKIYDTERQISILGEDGATAPITLNQTVIDQQTGNKVVVNDLSVGKYDVTASSGPSYATERVESLNFLTKLSESNPMFSSVATDLIAKSIDFDYSEILTERVRKTMIQQGIVEPTPEEMEKLAPQEPSAVDKLNFKALQLDLEYKAGLVDALDIQNRKTQADLSHKLAQTQNELTKTIKTKTEINKNMIENGNENLIPIEPDEINARQRNLQALNDNLELDIVSASQVPEMTPIAQQPPQVE
jgi:hypothetical protein